MGFLTRSVPLHFWLVVGYTIMVAVTGFGSGENAYDWDAKIFTLPLFEGGSIDMSSTGIIMVFGFIAQWLEAIRATRVSGTARNDVWSLLLAVVTVVLFIGVAQYQTFAFFVIVIVAFGDVLLDRIIGQAVAQRDFGGLVPGGE